MTIVSLLYSKFLVHPVDLGIATVLGISGLIVIIFIESGSDSGWGLHGHIKSLGVVIIES